MRRHTVTTDFAYFSHITPYISPYLDPLHSMDGRTRCGTLHPALAHMYRCTLTFSVSAFELHTVV